MHSLVGGCFQTSPDSKFRNKTNHPQIISGYAAVQSIGFHIVEQECKAKWEIKKSVMCRRGVLFKVPCEEEAKRSQLE